MENHQPEYHQKSPRTKAAFSGPFPDMDSEESANAGNRPDRTSKGFSIAGAVSA